MPVKHKKSKTYRISKKNGKKVTKLYKMRGGSGNPGNQFTNINESNILDYLKSLGVVESYVQPTTRGSRPAPAARPATAPAPVAAAKPLSFTNPPPMLVASAPVAAAAAPPASGRKLPIPPTRASAVTPVAPAQAVIVPAPASVPIAIGSICYDRSDPSVVLNGTPIMEYLSVSQYTPGKPDMYSDHAPIIYDFSTMPAPLTNPFIKIITWNVAQWGNYQDPTNGTYNHKFNLQGLESKQDYMVRLNNLVKAMNEILEGNKTGGKNYPFLFCQELPAGNDSDSKELRAEFERLLLANGLGIVTDTTLKKPTTKQQSPIKSEFGVIYKSTNPQNFTVINKSDYWNYKYANGNPIFLIDDPANQVWKRFEIYYYDFTDKKTNITTTFYYVNIHAKFTEDAFEIFNFLNRILDVIYMYHVNNGKNIHNVTVYIVGDYNYNIASPEILSHPRIRKPLFENPYLKPPRQIKNTYKITTQDAKGHSLQDNDGNRVPCNIDCLLKIDFA